MKYRRLGCDGPLVSAIGMRRGTQPVQSGEPLEQEFNAAIGRALELGVNLFDSSDAYWGARHEVLLGRALKGRRDAAQIITKFGNIDLPLGRGLLTGRIKTVDDLPLGDRRRKHPRFKPDNLARNVELVEQLEAIAGARGVSSAQLALAWLLAQGDDIVPIPGTNHVPNLEQNAAAVDIVLSTDELRRLDQVFAPGAGAGERYMASALAGMGL